MKKSILITGVSGSGKSTIGKKLQELGYTVHDIENIPDMFTVTDSRTGEVLKEWDTNNLNQIRNLVFECNADRLANLINNEQSKITFYCGTATNIEEIISLFETVILLKASPETIKQRLSTRTTHDFARTPEMQNWILELKIPFEETLVKHGAFIINADGNLDETAKKVIETL